MKKYLFLSSAFLMTMAGANAADKIITSANTCTVDVLGVSDNNATANTIATWDLIDYTLNPGQYLNVTETSVDKTTCPAGSYCVGGGYTVETANNSIAQCPTTHPNSATGAGAQNQCYTACTVATANIAHATAVGGNDYYGDGADACYATACDRGYHVNDEMALVEKDPLIPVDYTESGNGYGTISADGSNTYRTTEYGLTANNTWATGFDYGTVYGKASCQPTHPGGGYLMANVEAYMGGAMSEEEFKNGLSSVVGPTEADLFMGYVEALMSGGEGMTEEEIFDKVAKFFVGMSDTNANYATDSTGTSCYCQMDGYQAAGGAKEMVTSAPWVFLLDVGSAVGCASNCAYFCANQLLNDVVGSRAFRAAVFGSLGTQISGICAANTINIDWNPDNNGAHIKNMCTYDGSITVPSDPVKPGYTFTGWKLLESTTTE